MQVVKQTGILFLSLLLSACYRPPYNQFERKQTIPVHTAVGAGVGSIVGVAAGSTLTGTGIGVAAGAVVGAIQETKAHILQELKKHDIQVVQYGELITLVVPTDRYYVFNSARLHELEYPGLEAILSMVRLYPHSDITVAAFSDGVGSSWHEQHKMTDARAHTMVAFLWANGISSQQLRAEGLGAYFPIGDNHLIHGSAHNRRLEIQWKVNQTVRT